MFSNFRGIMILSESAAMMVSFNVFVSYNMGLDARTPVCGVFDHAVYKPPFLAVAWVCLQFVIVVFPSLLIATETILNNAI